LFSRRRHGDAHLRQAEESMLAPHEIGPCRRVPHELSANSRLISAGQFGAGSFRIRCGIQTKYASRDA